jgi:hypothetical protein
MSGSTAATASSGATSGAGSTSAGTGAGSGTSDPCSLITQAEVATAVGVAVGPGSNASNSHECSWQFPANGVPTVQVSIDTNINASTFAGICGVPSNPTLGITVTQVTGIGDSACYTEAAGLAAGNNLTFEKDGRAYSVAATLGPTQTSAAQLDADKKLALDALARL